MRKKIAFVWKVIWFGIAFFCPAIFFFFQEGEGGFNDAEFGFFFVVFLVVTLLVTRARMKYFEHK